MKVVLFCGGMGTRLREYSETIPKPMVPIGNRPILWHILKYYAHYGHKDFILCLGYKADVIKDYFLNYSECISNDFVLSDGGKRVKLLSSDMQDWRITFVDTGLHSSVAQRLRAVREHLDGEEVFLANYTDCLTDVPLPTLIDNFQAQDKSASFLCVQLSHSFHVVRMDGDSRVTGLVPANDANIWINGGYFVFRRDIFDYIGEGDELVVEPFERLIRKDRLCAYPCRGFWACMDTFKERQTLEELWSRGKAPWEVWKRRKSAVAESSAVAVG